MKTFNLIIAFTNGKTMQRIALAECFISACQETLNIYPDGRIIFCEEIGL